MSEGCQDSAFLLCLRKTPLHRGISRLHFSLGLQSVLTMVLHCQTQQTESEVTQRRAH